MALKLAFSNQKGGAGKTSCTVLAANILSQSPFDFNILVLDTDRQQSIVKARSYEEQESYPYEVKAVSSPQELDESLTVNNDNYDIIFIDSGGKLDIDKPVEEQDITRMLAHLDYLFIPLSPGTFALDASLQYIDFAKSYAKKLNDPYSINAFFTMFRESYRNHQFIKNEFSNVDGINLMRTMLKRSTVFEDLDTHSSWYNENSNDAVKLNITIWINEIYRIITK